MEPIYTVDWFSGNIPVWTSILDEFKGKEVEALEIGSFQGRSSRWLMENILTHSNATLTCVDTFEGSVEHSPHIVRNLRDIFDYNLKPFENKIKVMVGHSASVLPTLETRYDFAYVDGDHRAFAVLEDAVNTFRLIKFGGIMIFDDYLWNAGVREIDNPRIAIDAFLEINKDRIVILHSGYQLIVRKIVHE